MRAGDQKLSGVAIYLTIGGMSYEEGRNDNQTPDEHLEEGCF